MGGEHGQSLQRTGRIPATHGFSPGLLKPKSAWGGYRAGPQGAVGGVRTSEGAGAAAWDTRNGQGAVAKGKDENVYAGRDGNVYRKDNSGNWGSNTGSGWKPVDKPQRSTPLAAMTIKYPK